MPARFQSTYNPEVALAICERIAEGETLSEVCKAKGMPSRQTFHRWVVRYPELSRAYSAARELSAHSLEEEALDTARELKDARTRKKLTPSEVRALDVAMGQLRWSASRRNPRVYSERGSVSVTVPIQINTSLDLADTGGDDEGVYRLEARTANELEPTQTDHGEEAAKVEGPDGQPLKPLLPKDARRQKMDEAAERHGPVHLPHGNRGRKRGPSPQQEAENARDRSTGDEN